MKYILAVIVIVGFGMAGVVAAEDSIKTQMDTHVDREGQYWLNGTPNEHQRYSALCGVFRQDSERRQIAVVYVDKWDASKNEITGEPVGNRTVVDIVTDDMDYVYGARAISKLCGTIPQILVEQTVDALTESTGTSSFIRNATGAPNSAMTDLIEGGAE